jgi:hypothetical protein
MASSLAKTPADAESFFEDGLERLTRSFLSLPHRRAVVNLRVDALNYETDSKI